MKKNTRGEGRKMERKTFSLFLRELVLPNKLLENKGEKCTSGLTQVSGCGVMLTDCIKEV